VFQKLAFTKNRLVILATAFLTFSSFMATSLWWGGTALGGKIEGGRFYVGERGEFREVGRGNYVVSAALSTIWPPALALVVSHVRVAFPKTPDTGKLFVVLTILFCLAAASISIASLLCLLRALA
jgi:hypothetical protein